MDINEVYKKLDEAKKNGAFIFIPSPVLSEKESFYMPVLNTVYLNKEDVYNSKGSWRINYVGLSKLSRGADIKWSSDSKIVSISKDYCAYSAVGGVRQADGSMTYDKAYKDKNLDVEHDNLKDKYYAEHPNNIALADKNIRRDMNQERTNLLMKVESGAKSRVIRFILGIPGSSKNINTFVDRPFVFVNYVINYAKEEVKNAILGALPSAMNILGGKKEPERIECDPDVIEAETEEPEVKQEIKFENYTIPEQIKILEDGCKSRCLDWKEASCGIDMNKANQNQRTDFYDWIKKEKSRC